MVKASELLAMLGKDPEFLSKKRKRDEELAHLQVIFHEDEKEMLKELADIGYYISSIWDFVNSDNNYLSAVPILIRHLKQDHHNRILAGIARSVAISDLSDNEALWEALIERYQSIPSDKDIDVPSQRGAQSGLGLAIAELATNDRIEIVSTLVEKYPESDGVVWFKEAIIKHGS